MSDLLKIAADAENDCSCALWDYPEALRSAHVRIEELEAEQDRLSSKVDTLELLRPHWAQGYSSDSVAAQASTAALVAFWEILGVSDQTSAINALKDLTAKRDEALERDAKAHEKEIAVWSENYAAMERKLEAARADTKKAVEALRLYACKNECNDGRCHCSGNDCGQHASATLAEIEGEKK